MKLKERITSKIKNKLKPVLKRTLILIPFIIL